MYGLATMCEDSEGRKHHLYLIVFFFYLLKTSTEHGACRSKKSSSIYKTVCCLKECMTVVYFSTLTLEFMYCICNQPGQAKCKAKPSLQMHTDFFFFSSFYSNTEHVQHKNRNLCKVYTFTAQGSGGICMKIALGR